MSRSKLGLAQLASNAESSEEKKDVFYVEEFSADSDFAANESAIDVVIEYTKDGDQLINFPQETNSSPFIIPTMDDHEVFIMHTPDMDLNFDFNEQMLTDSFDNNSAYKEEMPEMDFDLMDD